MKNLAELFPHYHKLVKGLITIDVYRVLQLWDVRNPCVQHAIKKLLCLGIRGAKDVEKDLNEAIFSLQRAVDMAKEDAGRAAAEGLADEPETPFTIQDLENPSAVNVDVTRVFEPGARQTTFVVHGELTREDTVAIRGFAGAIAERRKHASPMRAQG